MTTDLDVDRSPSMSQLYTGLLFIDCVISSKVTPLKKVFFPVNKGYQRLDEKNCNKKKFVQYRLYTDHGS